MNGLPCIGATDEEIKAAEETIGILKAYSIQWASRPHGLTLSLDDLQELSIYCFLAGMKAEQRREIAALEPAPPEQAPT